MMQVAKPNGADGLSQCGSALVLLSGGVDSACCAHFYLSAGYAVSGLFVDLGQASRIHEAKAAAAIAQALGIPLAAITIAGLTPSRGKIQGRNAALLVLGLMHFRQPCGVIATGIHAGTAYEDCSPQFVSEMQRIADLYTDGQVRVGAPFLQWTKQAVMQYARAVALPLHLTRSCESGTEVPCGLCLSCKDIEALNV